jgi:hypothetical protein
MVAREVKSVSGSHLTVDDKIVTGKQEQNQMGGRQQNHD